MLILRPRQSEVLTCKLEGTSYESNPLLLRLALLATASKNLQRIFHLGERLGSERSRSTVFYFR